MGDADGDGAVTILDVTRIQRHLVQHNHSIEEANMKSAIVSGEDELSIVDATLIQRYLAGVIERFPAEETAKPTEGEITEMKMLINNTPVTVKWEENEAVEALKEAVKENPLIIHMSMYGGFEQVGSLGMSLPRNDTRITTSPGDVILYSGNQMVVFYGSNTWAYTRLGHITNQTQQELSRYQGKVLLLHGDKDNSVDISYSDRLSKVLPNVEYHVISGGGHEFFGQPFEDAVNHITSWLENNR